MSLDEKLFGWMSDLWGKSKKVEHEALENSWKKRLLTTEVFGSLLLGEKLQVQFTETAHPSTIDCIYFPELKYFADSDVVDSLLRIKILFHALCVKNKCFLSQTNASMSLQVNQTRLVWNQLFSSSSQHFPAFNAMWEGLIQNLKGTAWENHWNEFIHQGKVSLEPSHYMAFPLLPSSDRLEKKFKNSSHPLDGIKNQALQLAREGEIPKIKSLAEIERVTVNEEDESPLIHVFEKLLTADEYKKGSRRLDGSDSMEDDISALESLKIDKLIRSSEETSRLVSTELEIESLPESQSSEMDPVFNITYPEWFCETRSYRDPWCYLLEKDHVISPKESTVSYDLSQTINHFKHQLEFVVNQSRWVNRQKSGSDIDIDSSVRFLQETKLIGRGDERFYVKRQKVEKDFALLLLLDGSSSVDSWVANRRVLDEIQKMVHILSSVFEEFPSSIGISLFTSDSRLKCSYDWIKKFENDWTGVNEKMSSITPRGYTRMGVALRHSKKSLLDISAKKRVVIMLTDAKPTDFDRYEGVHGREDVRKAIEELESTDIQFLALVISDKGERNYFNIFGEGRCQLVRAAESMGEAFLDRFISVMR